MSKRSPDFLRRARDFYATPARPAQILAPHLSDVTAFCEPCCGDGALIRHLQEWPCVLALDLQPTGEAASYAVTGDTMQITEGDLKGCSHFITNPPWPAARTAGNITLRLIWHLSALRPTWLLLSADFMHNSYAVEVLKFCPKIVSVGRVKWIPDSKFVGKDNCAWYLFDRKQYRCRPTFYAREGLWTPRSH